MRTEFVVCRSKIQWSGEFDHDSRLSIRIKLVNLFMRIENLYRPRNSVESKVNSVSCFLDARDQPTGFFLSAVYTERSKQPRESKRHHTSQEMLDTVLRWVLGMLSALNKWPFKSGNHWRKLDCCLLLPWGARSFDPFLLPSREVEWRGGRMKYSPAVSDRYWHRETNEAHCKMQDANIRHVTSNTCPPITERQRLRAWKFTGDWARKKDHTMEIKMCM